MSPSQPETAGPDWAAMIARVNDTWAAQNRRTRIMRFLFSFWALSLLGGVIALYALLLQQRAEFERQVAAAQAQATREILEIAEREVLTEELIASMMQRIEQRQRLPAAVDTAESQEISHAADVILFQWMQGSTPNWALGALYALLGLFGALVVMLSLVGGAVPGTAGQVRIDADSLLLERLSQKLEDLIASGSPSPELIAAVERTVDNLRDDLRAERWRQFFIAGAVYALLGAFFASVLAKDLLQAVVIGAGWTGITGILGIKSDFAERSSVKDQALQQAAQVIEIVEESTAPPAPLPGSLADEKHRTRSMPRSLANVDQIRELVSEIYIARKL